MFSVHIDVEFIRYDVNRNVHLAAIRRRLSIMHVLFPCLHVISCVNFNFNNRICISNCWTIMHYEDNDSSSFIYVWAYNFIQIIKSRRICKDIQAIDMFSNISFDIRSRAGAVISIIDLDSNNYQ